MQQVVGATDIPWLEEDDAQLLGQAPQRYAELRSALSPLTWQMRLASQADLLREVARMEPAVRAACTRLASRLEIEDGGRALPELLERLERTRELLERRAATRLGRPPGLPLEVLLGELEQASMAAVPLPVDDLEAWRLARRLLPRGLPLLEVAVSASARIETFAARGASTPSVAFLPPPTGLPGVLDAHQLALEAVEALRARMLRLDLSGRAESVLWTTGRTPPRGPPRHGAEQLCAAIFWTDLATSRLVALGAALVAPLPLTPSEWRPVLEAWITAGGQRLPEPGIGGAGGPGRVALLRLAMWIGAPRGAFHPAPQASELRSLAASALDGTAEAEVHAVATCARAALLRTGWSPRPGAQLPELVASLLRVQAA